jgi:hypothetical protein
MEKIQFKTKPGYGSVFLFAGVGFVFLMIACISTRSIEPLAVIPLLLLVFYLLSLETRIFVFYENKFLIKGWYNVFFKEQLFECGSIKLIDFVLLGKGRYRVKIIYLDPKQSQKQMIMSFAAFAIFDIIENLESRGIKVIAPHYV